MTYHPYPDGLDTVCQHCGCVPCLHAGDAPRCPFPEATLHARAVWRQTGRWPLEEEDDAYGP